MKVAVMGAGALGCYFGGRLVQAGADVAFIARGAHLEALQQNGLTVKSPLGDINLKSVIATQSPSEIGPVDMVLFLVKLPDTQQAAKQLAPLLHEETGVLSFQNGIDAWDWIKDEVGKEKVLGGTAAIPANIESPGIVHHSAELAKLVIGEFGGQKTRRSVELQALFQQVGVDCNLVEDIEVKIWEKFVMLSAFSAVTAVTRLPIGPVKDNPNTRILLEQLVSESFEVGKKACPDLPDEHASNVLQFLNNMPPAVRSSMLDDLNRGKPLELEHLSGAVVRKAAESGMKASAHAFVQQALSAYVDGAPDLP